MINASATQEQASEEILKNTQAFRTAYGRLNYKQQQKEQKAFCKQHEITAGSFRSRLAGVTRVSDSELVWFEDRVAQYFPQKPSLTL